MTQTDDDEPITGQCVGEELRLMQVEGIKEVKIGFCERVTSSDAHLNLRSAFDQVESPKYEFSKNEVMPSSNYLAASPVPIKAPIDDSHVLKDKQCHL